jgi:hypothetical protein
VLDLQPSGGVEYRLGLGPGRQRHGIIAAVHRHSSNHLPPQLRAKLIAGPDLDIDLDRLKETESQSLLANLVALRHRLFASLDVAEECGDGGVISRIAGQLHHNLEITGKLLGDLGVGVTNVNVLIMPQYVELRVALAVEQLTRRESANTMTWCSPWRLLLGGSRDHHLLSRSSRHTDITPTNEKEIESGKSRNGNQELVECASG